MHAVAPMLGWYVPASQPSHAPVPGLAAAVPGEHGVWSSEVEPAGHAEPAGHGWQTPSDVAFTVSLDVPAGQRIGADEPAAQCVPAAQPRQCVAPRPSPLGGA